MTFGQIIKAARKEKDVSQRDLAKKIGVHPTYLCKIENDSVSIPPSLKVIKKLAKFCDRNSQEMIYLSGRIPKKDQKLVMQLFRMYGDRFTVLLKKMHDNPKFAQKILGKL